MDEQNKLEMIYIRRI